MTTLTLRSVITVAALWISVLAGVALILLAFFGHFFTNESSDDNTGWLVLCFVTGVVIIGLTYFFSKNVRNTIAMVLLSVYLVWGGFLVFWTVIGLFWSILALILVVLAWFYAYRSSA